MIYSRYSIIVWNTSFGIGLGGNMKVAIIGYTQKGSECMKALQKMGFSPNDIIVCENHPENLVHFWSDYPELQAVKHMHELMSHDCEVAIIAVEETRLSQTLHDTCAVGIQKVLFMEAFELDEEDIAQIFADAKKHVCVATDGFGVKEFIESCRSA